MGNLLDVPKTEKVGHLFVSDDNIPCGVTGMQGWRIEMEDTHVACSIPGVSNHTFVAVYDGHGGVGASTYAAKHIIDVLTNTNQWKQYVEDNSVEKLGEALIQAYLDIDQRMRDSLPDTSGCTAVCAVITPLYIVCANAGDSRCVLGTNNQTKNMSEDHKPSDEVERRRIEKAGGCVQWKRVDGDLAVSRAMGDFQYKNRPDLPPKDQKVTVYPDITVHDRTPEDEVLILACDGVWDVFSSQDAVGLCRDLFSSGEKSILLVAEELIDSALNKGSRDNISAVVIQLAGARIGDEAGGGVMARRKTRESSRQETQQSPLNTADHNS